jgi:hypothetical protein
MDRVRHRRPRVPHLGHDHDHHRRRSMTTTARRSTERPLCARLSACAFDSAAGGMPARRLLDDGRSDPPRVSSPAVNWMVANEGTGVKVPRREARTIADATNHWTRLGFRMFVGGDA